MSRAPLGVGVVGCGLIGRRRALAAAASDRSRCVVVADPVEAAAREVATATGASRLLRSEDAFIVARLILRDSASAVCYPRRPGGGFTLPGANPTTP